MREFSKVGSEVDDGLFSELCFCLLTPQSKARACDETVKNLAAKGLLVRGSNEEISREMKGVRFQNNKAKWIVAARKMFYNDGKCHLRERLDDFNDPIEAREWLVNNVLGLGYKEAGHFLRNIGRGGDFAILDRHILKNLTQYGVLPTMPKSLTRKEYIRIEALMKVFSKRVNIPMGELDLLFWSLETGEVFK